MQTVACHSDLALLSRVFTPDRVCDRSHVHHSGSGPAAESSSRYADQMVDEIAWAVTASELSSDGCLVAPSQLEKPPFG